MFFHSGRERFPRQRRLAGDALSVVLSGVCFLAFQAMMITVWLSAIKNSFREHPAAEMLFSNQT